MKLFVLRGAVGVQLISDPRQALNLNPNRNLARLRFLEIKSKITIKIGKKPFRPNSMVRDGVREVHFTRLNGFARENRGA